MSLVAYRQKRRFNKNPEPKQTTIKTQGPLTFVVQKHNASHLHYDFRLELDGVLKSWAVPKGPSLDPDVKRLAMMVEDHPLDYGHFEGMIPKGHYGAGTVEIWDQGVYSPVIKGGKGQTVDHKEAQKVMRAMLKAGHLTFVLLGEKLKGEFALVKTDFEENSWLLIKAGDEYAHDNYVLVEEQPWDSASKGELPHQLKPMLAETVDQAFNKPDWLFELKWDGYRALAEIEAGKVELYSRNGISYNAKFAEVTKSLQDFPGSAVLDGELVILDKEGRPHFQLIQDYPEVEGELVYYVFDLLYYKGHSLVDLPLIKRKQILQEILPALPHVRFSDFVLGKGKDFFALTKKKKLEGIVAKKTDSPYRPGVRSADWLKIRTHLREEAVIAGFTAPTGSRSHFGALVLGVYRRGKLQYIGHTGGGFSEKSLASTWVKLQPLIQEECPFLRVPKTNAPVTWVKPVLVAEVQFKAWTADKLLRQPIFIGLREDKNAGEVSSEARPKIDKHFAPEAPDKESLVVMIDKKKLTLSHVTKTFWPKEKYTKADLIEYYNEISPIILPYLKGRPQSLLRFPDGIEGESFFQKDSSNLVTEWLERTPIKSDSDQKTVDYLLCQDRAALIYMVNLGCIDFNPWNSRVGSLDKPDYFILDLDPEKTSFDKVVQVAIVARKVLENLDIKSFPKTSGKRGLHIYTPTGGKYTFEQVRQLAQLLALEIQKKIPDLVSLKHRPEERQGKVYIDYLRNSKGATTASVYSVRAWPGATVSTPLKWVEVNKRLDPSKFTIKTLLKRLGQKGDLFKGVLGKGIDMEKILKKMEDK